MLHWRSEEDILSVVNDVGDEGCRSNVCDSLIDDEFEEEHDDDDGLHDLLDDEGDDRLCKLTENVELDMLLEDKELEDVEDDALLDREIVLVVGGRLFSRMFVGS